MSQMKLGWWRSRSGSEHKIVYYNSDAYMPWVDSTGTAYYPDGGFLENQGQTPRDLVEFICELHERPDSTTFAVKAAEDQVRRLEQHHAALQNQANFAFEILTHARRELERLEKECEVGK